MQKFWSFSRGRIILIMMKYEAICRALLNLTWKVLEAPSLWVTKIVSYRKNYILPFGKKKLNLWGTSHTLFTNPKYVMGVHVILLLSDVPSLPGQREESFLWRMYARLYVRISSMEEYLIPSLKYDWYFCCVCVLLISFSNQVADKLKTPFITRIVLRSWANSVKG